MRDKIYNGYREKKSFEDDINDLNKSIDNLSSDNNISNKKLIDIENDIKRIENNIKVTKRDNTKKTCIRNIKIFAKALQGVFPYLVGAGLVFTVQTLIGDVPFYPQDVFKMAQHEQIIDSTGIISDNVIYVSSSKVNNSAYYSTRWEKKDDGKYYRMIKEYNIGNYTIEELKELIKNPNLDFEKTFGKNTSIKYEVKNEDQITEEDLDENTGFKIVYRYTDEEDVVLRAQDIGDNIGLSALFLLATLIPSLPIACYRDLESNYCFSYSVEEYCRRYHKLDIKPLEVLFKEKKIKFEFVKHHQVSLVDPITKEKILVK